MKQTKYKKGKVITHDGQEIEFTLPKPLTIDWMKRYAYHHAKVAREDIKEVIPIS